MSRTASGSGQSKGRASKRAKLDEDVDMDGVDDDGKGVSKAADDLVSTPNQAGLIGSWTKRLVIYEITCGIDYG